VIESGDNFDVFSVTSKEKAVCWNR